MAQHDMVIDNADGLTVRTDFNAAMQALVSCSSGPVEPATKYAGQLWLDTTILPDGVLRQRNQGNTAWVPLLLPSEFRFPEADLFFGVRTDPRRFVWNDKYDGSGADVAELSFDGRLTLTGIATEAGDVPTKDYVDTVGIPPGTVIYFASPSPPANYLKANGASLDRVTYAALFSIVGTTYGAVDSTHFNLPDLRGEFIRSFDDGRGIDAGRVFGSFQADDFKAHNHTITVNAGGSHNHALTINSGGAHTHTITIGGSQTGSVAQGGTAFGKATTDSAGAHTHTGSTDTEAAHTHTATIGSSGGGDTKPRNIALLACIKYQ